MIKEISLRPSLLINMLNLTAKLNSANLPFNASEPSNFRSVTAVIVNISITSLSASIHTYAARLIAATSHITAFAHGEGLQCPSFRDILSSIPAPPSQVDKVTRWGDLESDEEEESEEEEEEEEEEDVEEVGDGTQSQVSGYGSSLPSGIETPDVLDLRKAKAGGLLRAYLRANPRSNPRASMLALAPSGPSTEPPHFHLGRTSNAKSPDIHLKPCAAVGRCYSVFVGATDACHCRDALHGLLPYCPDIQRRCQ